MNQQKYIFTFLLIGGATRSFQVFETSIPNAVSKVQEFHGERLIGAKFLSLVAVDF